MEAEHDLLRAEVNNCITHQVGRAMRSAVPSGCVEAEVAQTRSTTQ